MYYGIKLDWHELNKHLTGNDHIDDSGPAERFAEALGYQAFALDEDIFIGFQAPTTFSANSASVVSLKDINQLGVAQKLALIVEKIRATGYKGEIYEDPLLVAFGD